MKPLVYVAAPLAGDVERNVRRAAALARLVVEEHGNPICVHPAVAAGVYGDDHNAEHRRRGLSLDLELLVHVHNAGGQLVALLRDDGSASPGTAVEMEFWVHRLGGASPELVTWSDLAERFAAVGLAGLHAALTTPTYLPPAPPAGWEVSL
ncbi:MAG TPA: hypothetical protein VEB22_15220 [Phycisphaerales bacterium]|nr:hypothetical protein [Phycisphaerales bacterium]